MDKVITLVDLVRHEVDLYNAGGTWKGITLTLFDEQQQRYAVIIVPDLPRPFPARVVVMAQVVDDKIVIIEDTTDKPLYEALMVNAKIPREQIILEYAGEKLPQAKAD